MFSFRVVGRVQGVGYRWFVRATAEQLGVFGWVANERDGSVVGEVRGEPATVNEFLAELERGPAAAAVSGVTRALVAGDTGAFTMFEIRQ